MQKWSSTVKLVVRQQSATTMTMKVWSTEADEALQQCFQDMDWDLFLEDHMRETEGLSRCITDYISQCIAVLWWQCCTHKDIKSPPQQEEEGFNGRRQGGDQVSPKAAEEQAKEGQPQL